MAIRTSPLVWFTAACAFALPVTANAASLEQVKNRGVSSLPADATQYVYVPDEVAAHPPILALAASGCSCAYRRTDGPAYAMLRTIAVGLVGLLALRRLRRG